jgi:radical SAM protein with 4Fe4S-binding SPASM domain
MFGLSICYTKANFKTVTSDEFLDMVIEKGAKYIWYFHYMPVGNDASTDLLLDPDEREYMYHRVREIRGFEGGKPIMAIDFQNDGEFVGGCVAGGREYCHINPNGDVEPCVFIHYSSANIKEKSLIECLQQPIFKKYRDGQPFNKNMLRPCPMLENPDELRRIVAETGAHSTDMQSPESVDKLCGKCDPYAKEWADRAEKLWEESKAKKAERVAKAAATGK